MPKIDSRKVHWGPGVDGGDWKSRRSLSSGQSLDPQAVRLARLNVGKIVRHLKRVGDSTRPGRRILRARVWFSSEGRVRVLYGRGGGAKFRKDDETKYHQFDAARLVRDLREANVLLSVFYSDFQGLEKPSEIVWNTTSLEGLGDSGRHIVFKTASEFTQALQSSEEAT